MKKIILLLLTATAFICQSCQEYNRPYDPYYDCHSGSYGYGQGYPGPQDGNHDLPHYGICDDYYNRYNLANGSSVIVTEWGTLAMYDTKLKNYYSLCWADFALYRNGYFLDVYRYDYFTGQLTKRYSFDTRENIYFTTDILLCCYGAETLYHRKLKVSNNGSTVYVSILKDDNYSSLEHFNM